MEYRRLGKAGMRVSAVSLGAWLTYGGSVESDMAAQCLRAAIDNGINFIDVADAYAYGEAERVVGAVIRDYKRADLVLSSKLFWPMSSNVNDQGLSRKHIMESIDKSLRHFGTDYLDIYFCHRFDPNTPLEETVRAMSDLVQAGKVLYWGTSVWEADQIEQAVSIAKQYNGYLPQVEQPRYNMLDRHIEPAIIPTCEQHGLGLTVWSPLAQGLLTGKYNAGVPEGSRGATTKWLDRELNDSNLQKIRQLTAIAEELELTTSQLALAWVLRLPQISSVITGATKPEHVLDNIKAGEVQLSADVQAQIEAILA
ncbi:aldo/keto reductase family protein [Herpetosiphon sp. NSE202]|uniref:aldo/keto reductase family protein n=1 Tax=Herpetosiphon sp. NSE202 TaxID=3351349 RepID=UPI00363D1820